MSFASIAFALFVPLVFTLYWGVAHGARSQNTLLVAASLAFYGWAGWECVGLLLLTAATTYAGAIGMEHTRHRRALAAATVAFNLGILGVFKYFNFFADNVASLLRLLGMRPDAVTLHLLLPVGISFYTLQAVGYTIDVMRGTMRAERNAMTFVAFISFFPQLVAGPIERATHLLPQMRCRRMFDAAAASDGLRQMLWGYVKKVVVADSCGVIVDQVWHDVTAVGSVQLWLTAVLFAFQIYCDFSGYSDIAIGCGRLFGINLSRNFAYPFFAVTMRELWRRWHMSLMSWFRDYAYIPLGGNRCRHAWRNVANLFIVFAVSGLWHGANWTFVAWGLYNALFVALTPRRTNLPRWTHAPAMMATTLIFAVGLIAFRAPDMNALGQYAARMFSGAAGAVYGWHAAAYCLGMAAVEWVMRYRLHGLQLASHGLMKSVVARWALYYVLAMTVVYFYLTAQAQTAFIYFRF